jgi:hypothetical protein
MKMVPQSMQRHEMPLTKGVILNVKKFKMLPSNYKNALLRGRGAPLGITVLEGCGLMT